MSAAPPRLILVDPCLDGPGSHPWQYAVAVLGAALAAGRGNRPDQHVERNA